MKKIRTLFLVLFMSFGLLACNPTTDSSSATSNPSTSVEPSVEPSTSADPSTSANESQSSANTVKVATLVKNVVKNVLEVEHVKLDGVLSMAENGMNLESNLTAYIERDGNGINLKASSTSIDAGSENFYYANESTQVIYKGISYHKGFNGTGETREAALAELESDKTAGEAYYASLEPQTTNIFSVIPPMEELESMIDLYLSIIDLDVDVSGEIKVDINEDLKDIKTTITNIIETPVYQLILDVLYKDGKTIQDLTADVTALFNDELTISGLVEFVDGFLPENYTVKTIVDYVELVSGITPEYLVEMGLATAETLRETVYETVMLNMGSLKVVDLVNAAFTPEGETPISLVELGKTVVNMLLTPVEGKYMTLKDIYNMLTPMIAQMMVGEPEIPVDATEEEIQQIMDAYALMIEETAAMMQYDSFMAMINVNELNLGLVVEVNENMLPTKFEMAYAANITTSVASTLLDMAYSMQMNFDYITEETIGVPEGDILPYAISKTVETKQEDGSVLFEINYGTMALADFADISVEISCTEYKVNYYGPAYGHQELTNSEFHLNEKGLVVSGETLDAYVSEMLSNLENYNFNAIRVALYYSDGDGHDYGLHFHYLITE